MILWDGLWMHDPAQMPSPTFTPAQYARMSEALAASAWRASVEPIPAEEQCCDFGADGCEGRAEDSGWCGACSAKLFPPRPTPG